MPFRNEHACVVLDEGKFQKKGWARMTKGRLSIVIGRLLGKTTTTTHGYRYNIKEWTEAEARAHCKREGGEFHKAAPTQEMAEGEELTINNPLLPGLDLGAIQLDEKDET